MSKNVHVWELKNLIPLVLALACAAEVGLRMVAGNRGVRLGPAAVEPTFDPLGPFKPYTRIVQERTTGDLSRVGNLPAFSEPHRVIEQGDQWGFRNPVRRSTDEPPDILLVGSSFTVGPNLEDEETLPARLGTLARLRVYNAGDFGNGSHNLPIIRELAHRLGMKEGLVLCEFQTRLDFFTIPRTISPPRSRSRKGVLRWIAEWKEFIGRSPLGDWASKLYQSLEDDRILPNPSRQNVIVSRLLNGDTMLFYPRDSPYPLVDQPERAFQYWLWLAGELKRENLRLAVAIVPSKTLVYGPLAESVPQPAAGYEESVVRVVDRLREAGIPTLDLTSVLRKEAREGLREHRLVYFRDDTHWNPEGVRIAAEEIIQVWGRKVLGPRPQ